MLGAAHGQSGMTYLLSFPNRAYNYRILHYKIDVYQQEKIQRKKMSK